MYTATSVTARYLRPKLSHFSPIHIQFSILHPYMRLSDWPHLFILYVQNYSVSFPYMKHSRWCNNHNICQDFQSQPKYTLRKMLLRDNWFRPWTQGNIRPWNKNMNVCRNYLSFCIGSYSCILVSYRIWMCAAIRSYSRIFVLWLEDDSSSGSKQVVTQ